MKQLLSANQKLKKLLDYFEFSSQESKEEKITSNLWMRKENIIKPR